MRRSVLAYILLWGYGQNESAPFEVRPVIVKDPIMCKAWVSSIPITPCEWWDCSLDACPTVGTKNIFFSLVHNRMDAKSYLPINWFNIPNAFFQYFITLQVLGQDTFTFGHLMQVQHTSTHTRRRPRPHTVHVVSSWSSCLWGFHISAHRLVRGG